MAITDQPEPSLLDSTGSRASNRALSVMDQIREAILCGAVALLSLKLR